MSRLPDDGPGGLDVLVLCTANVCRSPAAEAVLAARLEGTGLRIASAGLAARAGTPADERTQTLLPGLLTDFRAQQLTPALMTSARLVLTMTRQHRTAAVTLAPAAVRRTFTLTEFADLAALVDADGALPTDPVDRLGVLVARAPRLRGARAAVDAARPDEIADPYRLDAGPYRTVIAEVVSASEEIGRRVLGAGLPSPLTAGEGSLLHS